MKYEIKKNKVGDITKISSFEVHPMANIVPLDENLDSLKASIKSTGLLHPVMMYKGKIIDGRRRTMACLDIDIMLKVNDIGNDKELSDEELYNIVLAESTRRSPTAAQRAIIAAKQTMAGNHKLSGYTNASEYAKTVWDISNKTLIDAKWLVKNYKHLAEAIFEDGHVQYFDKKWTGVSGLVKLLKQKNTDTEESDKRGDDVERARAFKDMEPVSMMVKSSLHKEALFTLLEDKYND